MQPVSVTAFFCEDIREETAGTTTLVGVMPDNLNLAGVFPAGQQALLPKLGLYIRVHLDPGTQPRQVSARIINTDGSVITESAWERGVIEKSFSDTRANDNPIVSLVLKVVGGPFGIHKPR